MIASARPAPHELVCQWITERLRNEILEGQLSTGEWLRQEKLARRYGVSQMPVREALKQLAAEGLVRHEPHKGARVVSFSRQDVRDLYACRSFFEALAARSAAEQITDEQLGEMRALLERMKSRFGAQYIAEYREINRRFHSIIAEAAQGRSFLTQTLAQLWSSFPTMLWSNYAKTAKSPSPGRGAHDVPEHEAILAALEAHDPDAAESAVRNHIAEAERELLTVFEEAD